MLKAVLVAAAVVLIVCAIHVVQEFQGPNQSTLSQLKARNTHYTVDQLAKYKGENGYGLYIAILGEVFDVSAKPEYYGKREGYYHFTGVDGSRAFITGDFTNDVHDKVADFDPEACFGLVGWRDFYFKTYKHKGKLVEGAFYDAAGQPTDALRLVEDKARDGKQIQEEHEAQELIYPPCNSKYTEAEGGVVWCDKGMYPRKTYYKMEKGQPQFRCACFEDVGWSDLRQVYKDCGPDATHCKIVDEYSAEEDEGDHEEL